MKKKIFLALAFVGMLLTLTSATNVDAVGGLIVLKVTVIDSKGNPVRDAEVSLFDNEDDADAMANPAVEIKKTNSHGHASWFGGGLAEKKYYIKAKKGKLESESGLETTRLEKGKVNRLNVIVGEGLEIMIPNETNKEAKK
ncbi:hypothetical protein V6R21_17115 [Limibacter armeniacum]|uniref:hypothetical protein n=1 Tax=Limibacter armeniacum TaxID=466084 RepID=UPI002FE60545